MNKAELVAATAAKIGLTQKEVGITLDAILSEVSGQVAAGEAVRLVDFGTFSRAFRNPRVCRNPKTGEAVQVSGHYVAKFSPGKALKDSVGGSC